MIISAVLNFSPTTAHDTNGPNTYEELITYANRLEVFIYDGNQVKKSHLTGNYNVVNNEINMDSKQRDQRIVTLQLKDSNYTFEIKSSKNRCEPFEALCIRYVYNISTTFGYSTYQDYIFAQYNQSINHDTKRNVQKNTEPNEVYLSSLIIDSKTALDYAINYFENFVDYCNHLTYRLPGSFSISFAFPNNDTDISRSKYKTATVSIILNDSGNYTMTFPFGYEHDGTLKSYLESFMKAQNIISPL